MYFLIFHNYTPTALLLIFLYLIFFFYFIALSLHLYIEFTFDYNLMEVIRAIEYFLFIEIKMCFLFTMQSWMIESNFLSNDYEENQHYKILGRVYNIEYNDDFFFTFNIKCFPNCFNGHYNSQVNMIISF